MNNKSYKKYKKNIKFIKYLLSVVFINIIGGLIIYTYMNNSKNDVSCNTINKCNSEKPENNFTTIQNHISKPRVYGVDNKNNPYKIFADSSTQLKEGVYSLNLIDATFADNGKLIIVNSVEALLNSNKNYLELSKNVSLNYNKEYLLEADFIEIDYKANDGSGYGNVKFCFSSGKILSDKVVTYEHHNEIIFFGSRVKTLININNNM